MKTAIIKNENTKEVVLSFIHALNTEDFKAARNYVSDDLKFIGVLGTREGAEAYFQDMERMKLKYDIKKVFVDDHDVCLFYDIAIAGVTVFSCGWYHLENEKISWFRVVFDPRPIIETSNKKP
ncbi:MAG: nuclear transport factor 2 family protein [Bacteroidota bacterium]|nr:nuclear transport factor 2 family protein [Bacteroidota bacterium]